MARTSNRLINIQFAGDIVANNTFEAAENTASPSVIEFKTLVLGTNTITPPTGGSTPVAVTIILPPGNTATITLKGIAGDTGVILHKTDPSSFGLDSPTATFVLTASAIITGVQLVWS